MYRKKQQQTGNTGKPILSIRVSQADLERLEMEASSLGVSVSVIARDALRKGLATQTERVSVSNAQ
jgi:hypothetical protein